MNYSVRWDIDFPWLEFWDLDGTVLQSLCHCTRMSYCVERISAKRSVSVAPFIRTTCLPGRVVNVKMTF